MPEPVTVTVDTSHTIGPRELLADEKRAMSALLNQACGFHSHKESTMILRRIIDLAIDKNEDSITIGRRLNVC